jgi:uncharacterized protein (DUF169 family)
MVKSRISQHLHLAYEPIAVVWTDERPDGALQFQKGRWGCVMSMLAQAAVGRTAVFDRDSYGCMGGSMGLGFGDQFDGFNGGRECFNYFLSTGNKNWEYGREMIEKAEGEMRRESLNHFVHGEGYVKSPELVAKRSSSMPRITASTKYVVFTPLSHAGGAHPEVVVILADADQLSGLVVLANYRRDTFDNVYAPFAAGCQSIGLLAYSEVGKVNPRAVIGYTDPSARLATADTLGHDLMSFTVPYSMYLEMEDDVENSFLERETWKELMSKRR